ncbi:Cgi121p [Sporobolomyces koalae]|uniref:Cgi121p n=1 Tax=Sporobolomyces koalae TaxID=500713 RepID=UPI0031773772
MESVSLEWAQSKVHLALFERVENARELRQRLIEASTLPDDDAGNLERSQVDYAFVDASMITSRAHIMTAVTQALLAQAQANLKSKTMHSEVIWMLEPGTNISEALKHFGMSATTRDLLLVRIQQQDAAEQSTQSIETAMKSIVKGDLAPLDLLGQLPDGRLNEKSIRKIYKLNSDAALAGLEPGSRQLSETIDRIVTSVVALKSVQ